MDKSSKIISSLFLLGSLGILIAAFFLFLKDVQEEKLFYLNLVASCVVVTVIFLRAFDILGSVDSVAKKGSSYGINWYGVAFYTPLAVGLIVCSIIYQIPFNYCLIGHLLLILSLLMFFFIGSLTRKNVNSVMDKIESRKSGLKNIQDQVSILEMTCKMGNRNEYLEKVSSLRDAVRFITASDSQMAKNLEDKLSSTIQLINSQIEHNSQTSEVINKEFNDCMSIVELRKKQY